jgi:hypothetical protein
MRRSLVSLLFLAVTASACGGDSGTGPKATLPGSYNMTTVNTNPVPVIVYQDATYKLELVSGTFVVADNGTYTESVVIRETDSTGPLVTPIACPGTYTRSGNTLSLTEPESDNCGGTYTGTWDGKSTVTVDYGGGLLVAYKR